MTRILSCAVLLQALWMLAGCCGEDIVVNYEWARMTTAYLDNSGVVVTETPADQLPAGAFGIRVKLEERQSLALRLFAIPVARATSCAENFIFINRDTVVGIHIHALPSAPGSAPREITDDFVVMRNTIEGIRSFITIPELIRSMNEERSILWNRIDLIRAKGTEGPDPLRFVVTMEETGGRSFSDTMNLVTLQ